MYIRTSQNVKQINKDIVSQFTKAEIISIAEEFGLQPDKEDRTLAIIGSIFDDLAANGVPDTSGDTTGLVDPFLIVAEVFDDDGNQIDYIEQDEEEVEAEQIEQPECYGLGDDRDASCRRCKLLEICTQVRIQNRPPCFGQYFDASTEDCKICLEASFCKLEM